MSALKAAGTPSPRPTVASRRVSKASLTPSQHSPGRRSSSVSTTGRRQSNAIVLDEALCERIQVPEPSKYTTRDWQQAAEIVAHNPDVSGTGIWMEMMAADCFFRFFVEQDGHLSRMPNGAKVGIWHASGEPYKEWKRSPISLNSLRHGYGYYYPFTNEVKWDTSFEKRKDRLWKYRSVPCLSVADKFFVKLNIRLDPSTPRLATVYARKDDGLLVLDKSDQLNLDLAFWKPERVLLHVATNRAYIEKPVGIDPRKE